MNPFDRMLAKESSFTKKERILFDLFKDNPDEVLRGDINTWSTKHSISQSTLTRFCQKIGYNGFNEFKFDYFRYEKTGGKSEEDEKRDILDHYSDLILAMRDHVSKEDIVALAKSIDASQTTYIFGVHKSSLPAKMLEINLLKLSKKVAFVGIDLITEAPNFMTKNDLLIVFTAAGSLLNTYCKNTFDYLTTQASTKLAFVTFNDKLPYSGSASHYMHLPSSSNLNYPVYLENQIVFFTFVDLLTTQYAKLI